MLHGSLNRINLDDEHDLEFLKPLTVIFYSNTQFIWMNYAIS